MRIDEPLMEGEFLERPNRFLARVRLRGETVEAHVRDPGRLRELLVRGSNVYVTPADGPARKTGYDMVMARHGGTLVSLDSTLPNQLIHDALLRSELEHFRGYDGVRKEVRYGASRLDFMLIRGPRRCYLEVKSATLVVDGVAMFPDAVTARGTKHLSELKKARKEGHGACVLFVVQREDAHSLTPHDEIDPVFGRVLREAAEGGVRVLAYRCNVSLEEVELGGRIEVKL